MANIGNLVVRLETNIAKFESDLGRAAHLSEQSMKRIEKMAGGAMESLKRLDERYLGLGDTMKMVAAAAIGGGLVEVVKGSLEAADKMGKMAQSAGVSVESLSRMSIASRLADVDTETLAKGMGKASQAIAQAASGIGIQAQAFQALGIKVKDAHGNLKNADTIMTEVADKFSTMKDGAGKTAEAMAIFGKAGADLIPMLDGGGEEMSKFADLSDKLGLTLDNTTSQAAQDVNDRFTIMGMSLQGVGMQVMRNMLPAFDKISNTMMDTATNTDTMRTIADELSAGLKSLVSAGLVVNYVFQLMGHYIGASVAALMQLAHGDWKGALSTANSFIDDTKKSTDDLSKSISNLWDNTAAAKTKVHHTKHLKTSNYSQGGTLLTSKQDAAAESSVLQMMKGNFDQQVRARQEGMQIMSASARQMAQELDKIAASENKAHQAADKMFAGGKMTAATYQETLRKISDEAERQRDIVKQLQQQQDALNASWQYGAKTALQTYLDAAQNTATQSNKLFTNMFKGMEDALVNFVKTGKLNFSSLAQSIIDDLIRIQVQKAVANMAGSLFGGSGSLFGSANGNVFGSSGVMAFANGGVVNSPTIFPFANGTGLMGEAGPEAIMPLKRGPDGKLGVAASGGASGSQGISIMVNVDASGKTTTSGNDAKNMAQLGKRIGDVSRSVILEEMRPGGILAQAGVSA